MTANGEVCAFYLRTGSCKFGAGCRYSHDIPGGTPTLSASALAAAQGFTGGGFSTGPGGFSSGPAPGLGTLAALGDAEQDNLDNLCSKYLDGGGGGQT